MRIYIGLFLAFLATASGFYLTWRFTRPEFNGHWHIVEGGDEVGSPAFTSIHIGRDGWVTTFQSPLAKTIPGEINRFEREVQLGSPAHAAYFEVSWLGDTLLLTGVRQSHFSFANRQPSGMNMKAVRY